MSFENQIQQWVTIDNQLKAINEKARELRESKNVLCQRIMTYADEHKLNNSVIQLSDGKLRFAETNVSSSLTYKHLEKCLSEIIKNETQVAQIVDYVKKNREVKTISEIKRTYNN